MLKPKAKPYKAHTQMSLWDSAALVSYLGGLVIPSGDCAGEKMQVLPWERRLIRGACDCSGDVALSISRGAGKSGIVAGIATAAVDPDGPLNFGRADVVVVASAYEQSKVIFDDVLSYLRENHDLENRLVWRLQDSANKAQIEHRPTGTRVRCVGSDPKRAHGLRPALVLADEPAQWLSSKADAMLSALRTGLGKVPGSRLIALGTRPASGEHWFARMLDSPGAHDYSQEHRAGKDDPPFQLKTWRKANPSLSIFPSLLKRIRKEAADAKRDAALLPAFRALRLNMGTSDVEVQLLIGADTWARIEGEAAATGSCLWGADLGTSYAMSAISAYWPETGLLRCMAAFPRLPSLHERGIRDGVDSLYEQMAERDELLQFGQRAVDLGELIGAAVLRFGEPDLVVADRWRMAELCDALTAHEIGVEVEPRGQGYKDGGEDVRAFQKACVSDRVTPEVSLLMRSAMLEARTMSDPAGNSKLCKSIEGQRRFHAKDDACAAAILAVSAGERRWQADADDTDGCVVRVQYAA